uniref:3-oxo-5alpha-steroid 4-dehydrogenase (NADP(+)) n=3 Tax=Parascaris univalens TaxID=6257 RepID=A0A915C2G9_PARUN
GFHLEYIPRNDLMTDKIANITNALTNLERQYIEHKEKFEKWKVDNIKQRGSETYNTYVGRFHQWEMGVKEQQRQLIEERNNLAASTDIDIALDSLLTRISMKDFVLAVVTMTSKDQSFFPALLSAFKRIQTSGDVRQVGAYRSYTSTVYSSGTVHSYQQQYASTAVAAPAASHPYATIRQETSIGNGALKRPYENVAVVSASSTVTADTNWKVEEPARKAYRPPSPVKDYRNPSTLPFRDFSQT